MLDLTIFAVMGKGRMTMGKCKNCKKYKPVSEIVGECKLHQGFTYKHFSCHLFEEKSYIKKELWKRKCDDGKIY